MLMKCPECELQVSDKAISCPHCGYPLKKSYTSQSARKKPKRRRLPNGFGQISEIKGSNLRKPFRVMVTIGKTDEGKPICKLLQPEAYFETYNEAYQALIEHNKNPFVMNNSVTMEELYERWVNARSDEWSRSVIKSTQLAWKYCDSVKNIRASELRPRHIRACIDEGFVVYNGIEKKATPQVKKMIKSTFNKMMDYAVEYEIVDRNYSRSFNVGQTLHDKEIERDVKSHIPYTDEEISILWENLDKYEGIDVLLIQCYSGLRPKELELLEVKNINIDERIMTGGVKTKAGRNRIIPIHSKILDLVKKRYCNAVTEGFKYVFSRKAANGKEFTYAHNRFSEELENIKKTLKLNDNHRPHDGRVHFVTQAKKYEVDEYAIKRIVGHNINDVTEAVYAKRGNNWLVKEIEKIK